MGRGDGRVSREPRGPLARRRRDRRRDHGQQRGGDPLRPGPARRGASPSSRTWSGRARPPATPSARWSGSATSRASPPGPDASARRTSSTPWRSPGSRRSAPRASSSRRGCGSPSAASSRASTRGRSASSKSSRATRPTAVAPCSSSSADTRSPGPPGRRGSVAPRTQPRAGARRRDRVRAGAGAPRDCGDDGRRGPRAESDELLARLGVIGVPHVPLP